MNLTHRTLHRTGSVRRLAVVCLFLTLTACSTKFFYERIDWFVVWQVNRYISLNDQQKTTLKADVSERLEYMRVNDLPRVSRLLRQTAMEVRSGYVTVELIDARYNEMLVEYDQFMLGLVPLSMRFLRSLDEEQVAELFGELDEINEEMYEEYSGRTAGKREKNRNKSAIKSTERWTGRLRSDQKLLIKNALANMEDASEEWIDYQRDWQQRFRALIESRPPEGEYREELTSLFVYPRDFHSDEYRSRVESNRTILNAMLADLLTNLSDKQRKRVVDELESYADDLILLSGSR
jgi:Family of unknown function (DUF6279)